KGTGTQAPLLKIKIRKLLTLPIGMIRTRREILPERKRLHFRRVCKMIGMRILSIPKAMAKLTMMIRMSEEDRMKGSSHGMKVIKMKIIYRSTHQQFEYSPLFCFRGGAICLGPCIRKLNGYSFSPWLNLPH